MDGGDRKHAQYGAPYHSSTSGRANPGPPMGAPVQEQYSHAAPSPSRTTMATQTSARPYLPDFQYSYQQQQPFQQQLQYPSSYVQEQQRSQSLQPPTSQQQYGSYGQGAMLPPVQQPSMYSGMHNYQQEQRQSTAIEVMAGQFGSGSIPSYIQHGESSGSVSMGQPQSHYMASQADQQQQQQQQQHYPAMSYGRPQLQPPFTPAPNEYAMLEPQPLPRQAQEEAATRQATEEGKRQYEQRIRSVFDSILSGRVTEASETLLIATEWLFGHIRALGLHHDDEESHQQRLLLWRELNHAWEALGQKQKTLTERAIVTHQQPIFLLTPDAIRNLVDKVVQLSDQIEKYGLVDYEMGFWEEQIVDIFIKCLDLLSREQGGDTTGPL